MWEFAFTPIILLIETARWRRLWLLLSALCGAMYVSMNSLTASAQDRPLSTREMRTLSDKEASKVFQRDLSSLFGPVDRSEWYRLLSLRHADVPTHPYPTAYEGLCRRDLLQVDYFPAGNSRAPEDQTLRPYRVEVHAQFHAENGPVGFTYIPTDAKPALNSNCDIFGNNPSVLWFDARNDEEAAQLLNLLALTLDNIKAAKIVPSPCSMDDDKELCSNHDVRSFLQNSLVYISECNMASTAKCYEYGFSTGKSMTILASSGGDDGILKPVSVGIGAYVTVH